MNEFGETNIITLNLRKQISRVVVAFCLHINLTQFSSSSWRIVSNTNTVGTTILIHVAWESKHCPKKCFSKTEKFVKIVILGLKHC